MKIHFVLPFYNEEASIDALLTKIADVCGKEGFAYQVIAVDDGSRDRTPDLLAQWAQKIPLVMIRHRINRGLGETIRDGFEYAAENSGPDDIVIRMDGDNTHEPSYIPSLVAKIREGNDVVITSRFQPGGGMVGVNAYRTFISRAANLFMKILFPIQGVWDYSCGYRAFRASLVRDTIGLMGNLFIDLKGLGFTCTVEKLIKFRMMGARMAEVPFVLRYDQKEGPSKMLSSITTLGYFILAFKNFYPWGRHNKLIKKRIEDLIASKKRGQDKAA